MATIYDLIELSDISPDTTYSVANGNLLGVVDNVTSPALDDGEFDQGDVITIGGVNYTIDLIQEPSSSGRFTLGDGTDVSFDPGSESNLSVAFLTVSNGADVRHFIIPNDSYGDMGFQAIRTGSLNDVAGNDAAVISTTDNQVDIVCFVRGTLIAAAGGHLRPVESLGVGDRVITADHGPQPIAWIGTQTLPRDMLLAHTRLRPIRIAAGALGNGVPHRDLLVSPQHRLLVQSRIAQRMFATPEVLVAAKLLIGLDGIGTAPETRETQYFHLMLARHEILFANGAACESFFPGRQALKHLAAAQRHVVEQLLCGGPGKDAGYPPARPLVSGRHGRKLIARHRKNNQSLQDPHVKCDPAGHIMHA